MKILDLLEALFNTEVKPDKRYHGYLRQDTGSRTDREIAKGSVFSKVKDIKNEPHMVRKYNHRPMDPAAHKLRSVDGFNYFIEQIIERGETDNIHFPRVYAMKKIVDDYKQHIHTYDVEKLIPSSAVTREELLKVCEESFGKDDDALDYSKESLEDIISGKVIYALEHNDYDDIESESLLEALHILRDIVKSAINLKRGHKLDLHVQNIMYRRTPVGTQLVINDPIA